MITVRIGFMALLSLGLLVCGSLSAQPDDKTAPKAETKTVEVGKNVTLEIRGETRRVLLQADVCLREGPLEMFLCRTNTKEHESIVHVDTDARLIHTALLAAGAKPGTTVKWELKYQPATGSVIKVSVRYTDNGKEVTRPAQDWVRVMKTKKPMTDNWVFAGSMFFDNPDDPTKKFYAANSGDVICVSNFETAMLDLPVNSPKDNDELQFEAFTERIPPLGTKVTVILEPVPDKKK
jgi:hypothetical protein